MREKSLNVDVNDREAIRHGRHKNLGMCVSSEFYQPCPMFFTRESAQLNIVGQYRGASLFIIMNGPSLSDIDLNKLDQAGVMTYGINNGPKTYRPNLWTCVDPPDRFLQSIWLDPKIQKIVPADFFEKCLFDSKEWKTTKKKVGECPNVIGFRRNEKFIAGRFLWEDTINWGNHADYGGGRSVFLASMRIAFLLGFRKVYLLGCDFTMNENYTYHFDEHRTKGAVNCNQKTYEKMNEEYFPSLKPEFAREGFEIFNCNPNSGLTVFPHKSFDDAISEATGVIGNLSEERVYGMYSDPKDRDNFKDPNHRAADKPEPTTPETRKKVQVEALAQLKARQMLENKQKQSQKQNKQKKKSQKQNKQVVGKPAPAPEFADYTQKGQKGQIDIQPAIQKEELTPDIVEIVAVQDSKKVHLKSKDVPKISKISNISKIVANKSPSFTSTLSKSLRNSEKNIKK